MPFQPTSQVNFRTTPASETQAVDLNRDMHLIVEFSLTCLIRAYNQGLQSGKGEWQEDKKKTNET